MAVDFSIKKRTFLRVYDVDGSSQPYPIPDRPNGFGDYRQAFDYIARLHASGVEIPAGLSPVEVYDPIPLPRRKEPCLYSHGERGNESSLMVVT